MVELRVGGETHAISWEEWETRVRSGRVPPNALVRFEPATGTEWRPASELELYQSLRNDRAVAWKSRFSSQPPLLTALLVGVQIKLWWIAWWQPEVSRVLIRDLTLFLPPLLEDAQVWRLVTMGLAHKAMFHLALNMLWLAYCGWNLERALGRANLLAIFFGSVMAGSLLSTFGDPSTPSLGASGGVYGLVGASIVFGFARPHMLPERGRRYFGWALVPYLVVMFGSGLASEGTDNWSHLGGLLAGVTFGVLLDPPPVQRRVGWNRIWYSVVAFGSLALALLFATAGPRLHPIEESATASLIQKDSPLTWSVPAGWRAGRNAAGDLAWVSPAGPRTWSVVERVADRPITGQELRESFLEKLIGSWPDAQVEPVDHTEIAGHAAVGARIRLPNASGGPRVLDYRVTTRGLYSLQTTWEVDEAKESRLGPLARRLSTRTRWEQPASLESARVHYDHNPESPKARDAMATELARIGEVDAALGLRRGLVEQLPDQPKYWSGLLDLVTWYPAAVASPGEVWQAALDAVPTGAMAAAVAESMTALDEHDAARGLLEIAWAQTPADRSVRRSRERRGMSTVLTPEGEPWGLVYRPVDGERRSADEVASRLVNRLDVTEARRIGATLAAEDDAVVRAAVEALIASDLDRSITLVGWLRMGTTDLEPQHRERVHRDLHRAAIVDRPPSWMPPEIAAAARRHPVPEPKTP